MLISFSRADRLIASGKARMLIGFLLIVIPRLFVPGQPVGVLTGMTLVSFGIFATVLTFWKSDPGLWMLSALLLAFYGPLFVYLQTLAIFEFVLPVGPAANQQGWQRIGVAIDSAIALGQFGTMVRFLMTVTAKNFLGVENLRRSRKIS